MKDFTALLSQWLPHLAILTSILGFGASAWAAIVTRRRYYDEYRKRKGK